MTEKINQCSEGILTAGELNKKNGTESMLKAMKDVAQSDVCRNYNVTDIQCTDVETPTALDEVIPDAISAPNTQPTCSPNVQHK